MLVVVVAGALRAVGVGDVCGVRVLLPTDSINLIHTFIHTPHTIARAFEQGAEAAEEERVGEAVGPGGA